MEGMAMLTGATERERNDSEPYGVKFTRAIAREIFEEIRAQGGHLCLHAEEWGEVRASLRAMAEEQRLSRADIREMRDELTAMRSERKTVVAVVGGIASLVGAVLGIVFGR